MSDFGQGSFGTNVGVLFEEVCPRRDLPPCWATWWTTWTEFLAAKARQRLSAGLPGMEAAKRTRLVHGDLSLRARMSQEDDDRGH